MSALRYVVLSDLHLGAAYRLLTDADDSVNARPQNPSPTLSGLAEGFRSLVPRVAGGERPTLVLLGDVFDLSFATPQAAAGSFQRLVEAFWSEPSIFSDRIIYVPGNHDHQMWRRIRDAALLSGVMAEVGKDLPDDLVVTALDEQSLVPCELATALAQRATGNLDLEGVSGYPNIGFEAAGNVVVMHHGHYTEGTYRLMSKLANVLNGRPTSVDLREIELLNGPWIDFGWSETGDQAEIGPRLFHYYEMIQDPAATSASVQLLAAKLIAGASGVVPVRGSTKIDVHGFQVSVQNLTEALLDLVLARAAETERTSVTAVLSPGGIDGVKGYLAGPVRAQLIDAGWDAGVLTPPGGDLADRSGSTSERRRLSFVFGHTHKPFQDEFIVPGYVQPPQIWNTGGWVLDHPCLSPTQGGAAIFVDDQANVASLRLFNDPLDGSVGVVRAAGCHAAADRDNPLLNSLAEALQEDPTAWEPFSRECLAGLQRRATLLRTRFFDPTSHPPAPVRNGRNLR
jgi:predicted phosphodiesterase